MGKVRPKTIFVPARLINELRIIKKEDKIVHNQVALDKMVDYANAGRVINKLNNKLPNLNIFHTKKKKRGFF